MNERKAANSRAYRERKRAAGECYDSTIAERVKRHRAPRTAQRLRNIAVLDFETDPFDNMSSDRISPFAACLYSDQFETVTIWEENPEKFIDAVISAILALPEPFTIYAHNGGKFDYMFMISRLRGDVSFKGRGIMAAKIGEHDLRDSFHIIPERLASYHKQKFDYSWLKKSNRKKYRAEIIDYMVSDCVNLFSIVRTFIDKFGLKISIGQAAMASIKENYEVKNISKSFDGLLRQWYFGGRVECIQGAGEFIAPPGQTLKYIDVNSLYPYVMANYQHPIGDFHDYDFTRGPPNESTCFVRLRCRNRGALVARDPETKETTANLLAGEFTTSIHEYRVALRYGLLGEVDVVSCLDCANRTDFKAFVLPLYENRIRTKTELAKMKALGLEGTAAFLDMKKDDVFYKLLLNNGYGKFAQDPARYRKYYLTDHDGIPDDKWFSSIYEIEDDDERAKWVQPRFVEESKYAIWEKPDPGFRYRNVGTAASITGAARAVLLEALQLVRNPIYCDTDSIICSDYGDSLFIDKTALGAWDLEDEFSRVIICGKKLYGTWHSKPKHRTAEEIANGISPDYTIKSKGASGLSWADLQGMLKGEAVTVRNKGATLTRYGQQYYIERKIGATTRLARYLENSQHDHQH